MINLALNVASFLFLAFVGFMILTLVVGTKIGRGLLKIIFGLLLLALCLLALYLVNVGSIYWAGLIFLGICFIGWFYDKANPSPLEAKQPKSEPDPHPVYSRIGKVLIYIIIGWFIFMLIADIMGIFPH